MYDTGWAGTKNEAKAVEWYQKAAAQGNALAQNDLGDMYANGRGVVKNEAKAVEWYEKAATQGNATAQFNLGVAYVHGRGVAKNEAKAVEWYEKAATQGLAYAQTNLGKMYANGRGIAQDYSEALRLFQQAAAQGEPVAYQRLGEMYEYGHGVVQNLVEAQRWYEKAAKTLYPDSDYHAQVLTAQQRIARQLAPTQATQEQPRWALVIGNAAYSENPLANPVNDATDIAEFLGRLGFNVTLERDADRPAVEKAVDRFTRQVPRGSAGLFFFSGHGVQIDGVNYLLPIGARLEAASDVKYHAVAADWVLARMDESGMDVKLLFLDACRNNPLGRSWTRALTRGLAAMETSQGTLIAYATSPGKTAQDGTGRNSPFTAQLLRELGRPGRDIEVVLKAVRTGVQQTTRGEQIPWVASSMTGDFYIAR
jgi:TPR repeat protein